MSNNDTTDFYDIGGDLRLARPTVWTLVLGGVLAVVLTLAVALAKGPGLGVLLGLLVLGLSFYVAYQVNCTVVGACRKLAWFLVIMYVVTVVMLGIGMAAVPDAPLTPQALAAKARAQAQAAKPPQVVNAELKAFEQAYKKRLANAAAASRPSYFS
jgi:hypothetical protein